MTTLHDRLTDLAEGAPPGGPVPDLWGRAVRYHRRRRAGTVVIAAVVVVLLGALGTATWVHSSSAPVPAGPTDDGLRLPTRLYEPSRWLPTTEDAGPLGRLVAVVGSEGGLVGVSGSEGEYRRLDLPGWSELDDPLGSSDIAVSADGRYVAYWYVDDGRLEGVAAYDAVTDEVTRHDVSSRYGLSPNGFAWIGDRLWFSVYAFTDDSATSARGESTTVWSPTDDTAEEMPLGRSPSFGNESTTPTSVVEADGHRVTFYTPDGARPQSLRVDRSFSGAAVVSPDQQRLAIALDPDPSSSRSGERYGLAVLTPDGHGGTTSRRVPGVRTSAVLAWRDDSHVIVWTYGNADYQVVDVDAGRTDEFITPAPSWVPGMHLAAEAWSAPTYDAPAPPTPLDPRKVAWGIVAVVVAGLGALVLWRRRVRA